MDLCGKRQWDVASCSKGSWEKQKRGWQSPIEEGRREHEKEVARGPKVMHTTAANGHEERKGQNAGCITAWGRT